MVPGTRFDGYRVEPLNFRRFFFAFAQAFALFAGAGTAHAYEIGPRAPVHEAMTMLSQNCLRGYAGGEPIDCSRYLAEHLPFHASMSYRADRHAQPYASRWPDDPGRLLRGRLVVKFGLTFLACKARVLRSAALDEIGLLCSSHFGQLQFMHAMRSSEDETYQQTRGRILDWARLSYSLAAGLIPYDRNYCRAVAEQGGATAPFLRPESFPHCGDGSPGRTPEKWTIATPFAMRCSNLIFATSCSELSGEAARQEMQLAALGALLHLVQDSFSLSHVQRGDHGVVQEARIVCMPAASFKFYSGQPGHEQSDDVPSLDPSCADAAGRPVDDPVTAGAKLLWMLGRNAPADAAVDYIRERVLGAASV